MLQSNRSGRAWSAAEGEDFTGTGKSRALHSGRGSGSPATGYF